MEKRIYNQIGMKVVNVSFTDGIEDTYLPQTYYFTNEMFNKGYLLKEEIKDSEVNNKLVFEHKLELHHLSEDKAIIFEIASSESYAPIESFRIIKDISTFLRDFIDDDNLNLLIQSISSISNEYSKSDDTEESYFFNNLRSKFERIKNRDYDTIIIPVDCIEDVWI